MTRRTDPVRVRLLVHALDRTGPPMLALAVANGVRRIFGDGSVGTVAFRGGPLLHEFTDVGPTHVLLDPSEPWDHAAPKPAALDRVRRRAALVEDAECMLAVSVAATQCVPYLPEPRPPLLTWVVERGEDLHWLRSTIDPARTTDRWLAGSTGTARELSALLGPAVDVPVVAEFVEDHVDPGPQVIEHCRRLLRGDAQGLVVVGAGIATERKAPDLFIEAAVASLQRNRDDRFVWIGGEHDTLFHRFVAEANRVEPRAIRFVGDVTDVTRWLAAADVFCHTARLDAFPLVCLHAALAGTPVVGFAEVSGLEEMFGDQAITVPFPDVVGIADRIDDLRDPGHRDAVASAQADRVRRTHLSEVGLPLLLEHLAVELRTSEPRRT